MSVYFCFICKRNIGTVWCRQYLSIINSIDFARSNYRKDYKYMNNHQIQELVINLYNDPVYQQLKAYYAKTTIFNVFGIERNENRFSAFLCWLLNPSGSHGLGDEPVKKLLRLYASKTTMPEAESNYLTMLLTGDYDVEMTDIGTEATHPAKDDDNKVMPYRMDIWATFLLRDRTSAVTPVAMVVENMVYSKEGKDQTKRYHQIIEQVCRDGRKPVELFLSPEKPDQACESFVWIDYQSLLDCVIYPLTSIDMPEDAAQIINDFIRNLGRPSTAIAGKMYSVLAISASERATLKTFHQNHQQLFDMAARAASGKSEPETELLAKIWNSNEDLFKAVCYALKDEDESKEMKDVYKALLNDNNRDTTKYNVYYNGSPVGWHLNQARTAHCIFKVYLEQNPGTTLEELRNAFPRNLNHYHYFQYFRHLFYPAAANNPAWDCGKLKGQVGHDDFYTAAEDLLDTKDGKVMCVRWWKKTDGSFQALLDHVKEHCPYIQVESY